MFLCGGLVAESCPTLITPWTIALQAPLSMGFSRQEYWSGLKKCRFQVVTSCLSLENISTFWFSLPNLVSQIIRCSCYIQNFILKKSKNKQMESFDVIGYRMTFSKNKIFLPVSSVLFQYPI